jgi:hypothetical protein
MTLEQLQERRNALHVALAAVNGRLGPKLAVRRQSAHAAERACENASLCTWPLCGCMPVARTAFHADTIGSIDTNGDAS